jgi:hypothetical protein
MHSTDKLPDEESESIEDYHLFTAISYLRPKFLGTWTKLVDMLHSTISMNEFFSIIWDGQDLEIARIIL